MPAVHFKVQWPDGEEASYYSPSTIIYKYFQAGKSYSQNHFNTKVMAALDEASERVKNKFGYYCSAAQAEQHALQKKLSELHAKNITGDITLCEFKE